MHFYDLSTEMKWRNRLIAGTKGLSQVGERLLIMPQVLGVEADERDCFD